MVISVASVLLLTVMFAFFTTVNACGNAKSDELQLPVPSAVAGNVKAPANLKYAVKDMLVADVSLTGSWEKTLLQIERHTLGPDTFMASITDYTRKATREILNLSLPAAAARTFTCPKCKTGHIIVREKSARCDNKGCGLTVYRRFLNKELTDQHLEQLFSSGSTRLIKGFKGKKGVAFDASVTFDAGFTLTLSFPKNGNGRKRK